MIICGDVFSVKTLKEQMCQKRFTKFLKNDDTTKRRLELYFFFWERAFVKLPEDWQKIFDQLVKNNWLKIDIF